MNPIDYQEGDKVLFSKACLETVIRSSRSILAYPCDSFVEKLRGYVGQVGTVGMRFRPGYDFNLTFGDGQVFHCKPNWVEKV
jgi:hypothetical protein